MSTGRITERHAIRHFSTGWFSYAMTIRIKEENMIYLNEKRIAVIGIDHGYGNIKTANTITPTAITEYDTEPVFSGNILVYAHNNNEGSKPP